MPDKRTHRGPHPDDAKLFNADTLPLLQQAVVEMSWLLSRGYAGKSTLKLVGDRYAFTQRQRIALMRSACSDSQLKQRQNTQTCVKHVAAKPLVLDGYNILVTIEAALGAGVLLRGRDGCVRDLASMHGTYRKVDETLPAIETIASTLAALAPSQITWLLDKPVSNSGRLKKIILDFATQQTLDWDVKLAQNPDKLLVESKEIIATSDSAILDACGQWLNLADLILQTLSQKHPLNMLDLA